MEEEIPWYKSGPEFTIKEPIKEFLLIFGVTFIIGGLEAVLALIQNTPEIIPSEYLYLSGIAIAAMKAIIDILVHYKDGLMD